MAEPNERNDMSDQDMNRPAFPWHQSPGNQDNLGLTVLQHAAIELMIPMTGCPELDAMIQIARDRQESLALYCAALSGLSAAPQWVHEYGNLIPERAARIAAEASKKLRGEK